MADMVSFLSRPIGPDMGAPMTEASMDCLLNEAVEKRLNGGLPRRPCRRGFADHAHPLDETDKNSGGACRLDTIGQLARDLRARKRIRESRLHDLEKARDASANLGILASQFHGCGHQQAAAPAIGATVAVDIAGKVGPQPVDRISVGIEIDIHPPHGIPDVAVKRAQEERVLVTESGVAASTSKLRGRPRGNGTGVWLRIADI